MHIIYMWLNIDEQWYMVDKDALKLFETLGIFVEVAPTGYHCLHVFSFIVPKTKMAKITIRKKVTKIMRS